MPFIATQIRLSLVARQISFRRTSSQILKILILMPNAKCQMPNAKESIMDSMMIMTMMIMISCPYKPFRRRMHQIGSIKSSPPRLPHLQPSPSRHLVRFRFLTFSHPSFTEKLPLSCPMTSVALIPHLTAPASPSSSCIMDHGQSTSALIDAMEHCKTALNSLSSEAVNIGNYFFLGPA